jgi:hypothetical protein
MTKLLFLIALPFLSWLHTDDKKKEQVLLWSKQYFPEYYSTLQPYAAATIHQMAPGNNPGEYIFDIPTVVHEAWHSRHDGYFDTAVIYRINDTLSFSIRNYPSFPARQLNGIVPKDLQKSIFRYKTYINSSSKYLVTQQFGIHGIMEEFCAYYHSMRCALALYPLLKNSTGAGNPETWMNYLGKIGSYRYALHEFSLFTSWYLQYAKANHPGVYQNMTGDAGLRTLFRFLDGENKRLAVQYDSIRAAILQHNAGRLSIKGDAVFDSRSNTGQGVFDKETQRLKDLLTAPEHQVLNMLRQP